MEPEKENYSAESEDGKEGGSTALVPASLFGGDCEVGDKYTVEVVHKYENELEVKYVKKDKHDKPKESDSMDYKIDKAAMPSDGQMMGA